MRAVLDDVSSDDHDFLLCEQLLLLHPAIISLHLLHFALDEHNGVLESLKRDHETRFSFDTGFIAILVENIVIFFEVIDLLVELG